jgi:catechol 2,3-dioxygenase-like lactoylglutathione lyase family enzyme
VRPFCAEPHREHEAAMVKGFNHIGMSVSDLQRSIRFYCDGLGMRVVSQSTFQRGTQDGKYEEILGLVGATGKVALLKVETLQLELFEFSFPPPKHSDPNRPVCDHGITHFGIEVVNIQQVHDRLQAVGATFHCPPLEFRGNTKATYVRDLDGNVFELVELKPAATDG